MKSMGYVKIIKRRWAELSTDKAQLIDNVLDLLSQLLRIHQPCIHIEPISQADQILNDLIVEIARNPLALLLAALDKLRVQLLDLNRTPSQDLDQRDILSGDRRLPCQCREHVAILIIERLVP